VRATMKGPARTGTWSGWASCCERRLEPLHHGQRVRDTLVRALPVETRDGHPRTRLPGERLPGPLRRSDRLEDWKVKGVPWQSVDTS
jgi:hypothetical protein